MALTINKTTDRIIVSGSTTEKVAITTQKCRIMWLYLFNPAAGDLVTLVDYDDIPILYMRGASTNEPIWADYDPNCLSKEAINGIYCTDFDGSGILMIKLQEKVTE